MGVGQAQRRQLPLSDQGCRLKGGERQAQLHKRIKLFHGQVLHVTLPLPCCHPHSTICSLFSPCPDPISLGRGPGCTWVAPDPEVEPQREGVVTMRKEGEGTSILGKETSVLGLPVMGLNQATLWPWGRGGLGSPTSYFLAALSLQDDVGRSH